MRFGKPRKNQKRIDPRYHLNESAKIENNSSKSMHDVQFYLEEFYPFAKEALGFDQDATIVFESDFSNAKNPLGKTAHYDPTNSTVTVYVDKRHPKDVMRSVSHELVHHAQNVRGDLQGGAMEEGYAQTDDHLREMEKEAYTKGNMLFRDWTDSRNNPDGQKDIMARIMQEWGYDETALTEEHSGFEEGQLVKVVASALAVDGEKNGTVVSYEDPAVLIKLDDDQEGKYVPDDKMVKVKKDFVEPRAEAGFDDVMGESMGDYSWSQNNDGVLELKDDRGMVWGSVERAAGSRSTWNVYDDEGEEPIAIAYDLESAKSELLDLLDIADEAINEMYDDDDFGDDDLDMAALEKEFPWLAKDVKTREAPPEVAADLADEFGDKGEPEEEEEPVEMKESSEEGWDDLLANIMNHSPDANAAEMADKVYDLVEAGDIEGATDLLANIINHTSDPDTSEMAERAYDALEAAKFQFETAVEMKEKLSDEEEKEMTDKMSNKEFVKYVTHDKHVRPSIDRERYTEIPGLEGPFQYDSGAILYYDPKAGKYWDRDKDQYLDHEEAAELTMEDTENKNINTTGDSEMNIEEIVRAAVRRALKEKKYRREDEEEKVEETTEEAVTEGATNEEFEKLDAIVAAMGPEEALQALVQALPSHVVHETLDYIGQQYEIPFGDDEVEDFEGFDESKGLSAGQEELDLDDDGKIEPSDLAGLRAGKTDDEVGEEAEESLKETAGPDPIDFANEYDLDYQTDNEGNVVIYATQEQADAVQLPADADWQVEKSNEPEGGFVIYTNTPYKRMEEDVATPVALKGPFDPSQVQSVEDPEYGGMIHTLPNVELTGDLEQDVYDMIGGDEELYSWLWGEMESGDSITDAAGLHVYSGSDVQDHIKAHEESGPGGSHHYQENKSDKEWYDSKLFEALKRKWAKQT